MPTDAPPGAEAVATDVGTRTGGSGCTTAGSPTGEGVQERESAQTVATRDSGGGACVSTQRTHRRGSEVSRAQYGDEG